MFQLQKYIHEQMKDLQKCAEENFGQYHSTFKVSKKTLTSKLLSTVEIHRYLKDDTLHSAVFLDFFCFLDNFSRAFFALINVSSEFSALAAPALVCLLALDTRLRFCSSGISKLGLFPSPVNAQWFFYYSIFRHEFKNEWILLLLSFDLVCNENG